MSRLLIVLIFSFAFASAYGQGGDGDIRMKKSRFFEGENPLKPRDVLSRLEVIPEAHEEFRKAKANYDAAQVLGFVGGFMIGWPLGTAMGGGDPNWGLAAGGGALLLATLPLQSAFKKRASNALKIYNRDQPTVRVSPINIGFRLYGAGAGIVVKI